MAGPYSTDLRNRVLALIKAGETPEAAADRFAVAYSTAYRWAAALHDEGRREAKRMGGGPKPLITGAVAASLLGLLRTNKMLAEQHVHERARAVDGSVDATPTPIDLQVCLINVPTAAGLRGVCDERPRPAQA